MENFDPDNPSQELIHICPDHARRHLNPIIDWTTDEVWEFIHKYNVPYCKLYDEGYTRLGCIGCPMGTVQHRLEEFERWPKYKTAYIHAFDRMIEERKRGGYSNPIKFGAILFREWSTDNLGKFNYRMANESSERHRASVGLLDFRKGGADQD